MNKQHTLAQSVTCQSIGLHTGKNITMTIKPGKENSGIIFQRVDVTNKPNIIPASYDRVTETMLGTVIANDDGVKVSTIEHLMAALWGMGIDNALVELDGPEVAVMDGSSIAFIELIEEAGIVEQDVPRQVIEVLKEVRVEEEGKWIALSPADQFEVALDIDFNHPVIGKQQFIYQASMSFKEKIAQARTFGFEHEVEQMRAMGLARGGSLDNAIVIGKEDILNEGGLRFDNEFVRHKILDAIGDIFLAGALVQGRIAGHRSGHDLNNKLLRALFADHSAWKLHSAPTTSDVKTIKRTPPHTSSGYHFTAVAASPV